MQDLHGYPTNPSFGFPFLVEQDHQLLKRQHAIMTDGDICSQETMNEHQMCLLRAGIPIKISRTAVFPKVTNPGLEAPITFTKYF